MQKPKISTVTVGMRGYLKILKRPEFLHETRKFRCNGFELQCTLGKVFNKIPFV